MSNSMIHKADKIPYFGENNNNIGHTFSQSDDDNYGDDDDKNRDSYHQAIEEMKRIGSTNVSSSKLNGKKRTSKTEQTLVAQKLVSFYEMNDKKDTELNKHMTLTKNKTRFTFMPSFVFPIHSQKAAVTYNPKDRKRFVFSKMEPKVDPIVSTTTAHYECGPQENTKQQQKQENVDDHPHVHRWPVWRHRQQQMELRSSSNKTNKNLGQQCESYFPNYADIKTSPNNVSIVDIISTSKETKMAATTGRGISMVPALLRRKHIWNKKEGGETAVPYRARNGHVYYSPHMC